MEFLQRIRATWSSCSICYPHHTQILLHTEEILKMQMCIENFLLKIICTFTSNSIHKLILHLVYVYIYICVCVYIYIWQ